MATTKGGGFKNYNEIMSHFDLFPYFDSPRRILPPLLEKKEGKTGAKSRGKV